MSEEVEKRIKQAAEEGVRKFEEDRERVAQKIVQQIEQEKERDRRHGREIRK
jgi:type IV secretory pathway VirJ component